MFIFSFPNSQGKHFLIFQSVNLWGLQRTPWILASLCPSSVNLSTKYEKKSSTSEVSISSSKLLSTTSDLSCMTRPHPLTPRTDQTLALMPKVELLLPPAKSPKQVKSKASLGGESKVESLTNYWSREFNWDRGALVKKAIEASEAWDGWDWSDSEHPQMFLAPSLGQVGGIRKLKIHFDICMRVKFIAASIYLL